METQADAEGSNTLTLMVNHARVLWVVVLVDLWPGRLLIDHMRLPVHVEQGILIGYRMIGPGHPALRDVEVWRREGHATNREVSI